MDYEEDYKYSVQKSLDSGPLHLIGIISFYSIPELIEMEKRYGEKNIFYLFAAPMHNEISTYAHSRDSMLGKIDRTNSKSFFDKTGTECTKQEIINAVNEYTDMHYAYFYIVHCSTLKDHEKYLIVNNSSRKGLLEKLDIL